ncbi:MAG: hypothetical protein WBC33_05175 [Conexibacter sp.]
MDAQQRRALVAVGTDQQLAQLLNKAVAAHGGRVLMRKPDGVGGTLSGWEEAVGAIVMVWLTVAVGWFAADLLDLPVGWAWLAPPVVVLLVALGVAMLASPGAMVAMLLAAFVLTGATQLLLHDETALLWTHGVPGLVAATVYVVVRGRSLSRSAPLLLPLIIVVLFLPLFTSDLWVAANDLGWSEYGRLMGFVIVPLTIAVYLRLRAGAATTFDAVVDALVAKRSPEQEAIELLKKTSDGDGTWLTEAQEPIAQQFADAFRASRVREAADQVRAALVAHLSNMLVWRLLSTVVGVATLVAIYVYVLAWAAVTTPTASGWLNTTITMHQVDPVGTLPFGPYVKVALLFALVATAIFLAFVLTDEEYSSALSDALIAAPAERLLLVVVPYLRHGGQLADPQDRPTVAAGAD